MKGYKAFERIADGILIGKHQSYNVKGEYHLNQSPELCFKGFHFCTKIDDVFNYYDLNNQTIVCEVEAIGEITDSFNYCSKRATNRIILGNILPIEDIVELCDSSKLAFKLAILNNRFKDRLIRKVDEYYAIEWLKIWPSDYNILKNRINNPINLKMLESLNI